MTIGLNAAQARAKSSQDMIVFEEQTAIMRQIITDSGLGKFESYVIDNTTMTDSTPTTSTSESYFNSWQGSIVDRALVNQMNAVERYFSGLGYKIERITNTTTQTTFKWHIFW